MAALLLAGCGAKDGGKAKEAYGGQIVLKSLEVYSNAVNEEQIYHVSYPYHYFAFRTETDGGRGTGLYDLEGNLTREELAEGEPGAGYFVDYVKGLPENLQGRDLSYYVICRYVDGEGNEESIYRKGYDTFPEGFKEFVDRFNQICGGEYLSGEGEVQTVTPEFLTEVFGVTDEDVREGTLQDMIEVLELDMREITGLFRIQEALDGYYAKGKEPLIEPYRPKELVSAESTQEEYDDFLAQFLEKLDTGCVEEESDQEYFRRFYMEETGQTFYTARTEDIEKLPACKRSIDDYYYMELDAHMEDMVMAAEFLYSADHKFILVPMECGVDVITTFCE